ncbi:MAG: peptidoglycan/xylan/chitin deacetylase (PgdA/CDA1 family) [Lysobacterales bacterium]|jgi:peptidoglycan/xylan/chitin deacetylase (PgdA/CDA1 family)
MRKILNFLKFSFLFLVLGLCGLLLWISGHYVIPIMMYHHVDYVDEQRSDTVSPENFKRHMAFLKQNDYNVISLESYILGKKEQKKFPRNTVVITFDDAYDDNFVHAFSVTNEYNFPVTLFVPSTEVGTEGIMNKKQLRQLLDMGVTIGSHSLNHTYLPDAPYAKQVEEIHDSKTDLERMLDIKVDYFAYPIGGFSKKIKKVVRSAGYKAAMATNRGYDKANNDLFEINRIKFSDNDDDSFTLWIKLSGYFNIFRKEKSPF